MFRLWIGAEESALQRGPIYATLNEALEHGVRFAGSFMVRIELGPNEWFVFPQTKETTLGPGFDLAAGADLSSAGADPAAGADLAAGADPAAGTEVAPSTETSSAEDSPLEDLSERAPRRLSAPPPPRAPLTLAPLVLEDLSIAKGGRLEADATDTDDGDSDIEVEVDSDDEPMDGEVMLASEPADMMVSLDAEEPADVFVDEDTREEVTLEADEPTEAIDFIEAPWLPNPPLPEPPTLSRGTERPARPRPAPTRPPRVLPWRSRLVPRPDRSTTSAPPAEPPTRKPRAERKSAPLPPGQTESVTWNGLDVRLVNVSWTGARIGTRPHGPPHAGQILVIEVRAFGLVAHLAGQVRWVREGECGMAFDQALMSRRSIVLLERMLGKRP